MNILQALHQMQRETERLSAIAAVERAKLRRLRDRAIRRLRRQRWGRQRIARHIGVSESYVGERIKAMGLPPNVMRRLSDTMTPEQITDYRILVSKKGYTAAEARKMLGVG